MFKKKGLLLLILIIAIGLLSGCASQQPQTDSSNSNNTNQVSDTHTTYPLSFKDDTNTEVTIPAKPVRIISFVPSSTETLFALGLEGKVVAVTKWDDYPKDVQKKVEYSFEDGLHPNTEQILKLNPDLIVLGENDQKTIDSIRNLNIPVVVLKPENLESTYKTINNLGLITDTQKKAKEITSEMKEKQQAIEDKVAGIKDNDKLRVWAEVDPNLFTAGEGTFIDELITKAGGINIAHDVKGWAQYSGEKIIEKNPQVIFDTYGYYDKNAKQNIMKRSGWQSIDAVKNSRVIDLDSNLVTRPGPRIIDGLELIAKSLYPDLFK